MAYGALLRLSGPVNIAAGALLLAFWFSMPMLLPMDQVPANYVAVVDSPNWVLVNLLDVAAVLLGLLGLVGLYLRQAPQAGRLGLVGFLVAFAGGTLSAGIAFAETFIWPAVAVRSPQLLDLLGGGLYADPIFLGGASAALLLFGVGFALFGIATARAGILPRWAAILLAVGAPLFGFGVMLGPWMMLTRSVGAALYAVGVMRMGWALWTEPAHRAGTL